ncbi:MAG: DUF192 domain-containing protein [Holophagaceae bacterium]|nr:DUF192 domain-containing protein [Holophagaceae bacterium]
MRRIASLALTAISGLSMTTAARTATSGGTVTAKGKSFLAEVALSEAERAKGLMYRRTLAHDRCMFFIYEADGYHAIWMKNCLISLDVAWVSADGTVVEIQENVPPCNPMAAGECPTFGGNQPARHFVEFASGTFKRIGLKVGDRLGWDLKLDDGKTFKGGAAAKAAAAVARKKRK